MGIHSNRALAAGVPEHRVTSMTIRAGACCGPSARWRSAAESSSDRASDGTPSTSIKVAADSRTALGRVGVGVAVRQGAPKPDFSTVAAFKRALLNAKAIATSGEGSSGRYVAGLLERLGIAEEVRPKIRSGGPGASAQLVSRGEVDFVVSGLPPLIGTPNIEWLGYLPAEINSWLLFTGGVGTNAGQAQAGRALLKFLTTPGAVKVWKENGVEPVQ